MDNLCGGEHNPCEAHCSISPGQGDLEKWFVKRFGSKKIVKLVLKDFLFTNEEIWAVKSAVQAIHSLKGIRDTKFLLISLYLCPTLLGKLMHLDTTTYNPNHRS